MKSWLKTLKTFRPCRSAIVPEYWDYFGFVKKIDGAQTLLWEEVAIQTTAYTKKKRLGRGVSG